VRRYCSRCLRTIGSADPVRCPTPQCGSPRPARGWPGFLSLDQVLDERFVVREILGAGGAGITYRCEDRLDGGDIALKVLHDDRRHGVLANRLAIEGELLELLAHPHIVPFRGLRLVGEGPVYLATDFMRGGSLEGMLRRGGALTADVVRTIGLQLALALDYIHSQGIVHRDLKPGNVLVEDADPGALRVRLADFGIARVFRGQRVMQGPFGLTRTGVFIGTPEYAAPEQIRGEKEVGPAADAFALGALLHYAASLQPLLQRSEITDWDAFRAKKRDPSDRTRLVDCVDVGLMVGRRAQLEELDAIIDSLMQPDAEERGCLREVALALGATIGQLAPQDTLPIAPRSLVSALDEPWFIDDDVDALVPQAPNLAELADEPAAPTVIEAMLAEQDAQPTITSARSLERAARASVEEPVAVAASTSEAAQPVVASVEFTSIVPSDMGPEAVPPPSFDPEDELDSWDDGIDWPTPARRRRNRLHGALVIAAMMACGIALGWPGGPGALIGEGNLAKLGPTVSGWIEALATESPTFAPHAPWQGKKVVRTAATEGTAEKAESVKSPSVASSKPTSVASSKPTSSKSTPASAKPTPVASSKSTPVASSKSKPATSKPAKSKPATSNPATSKPSTSKPAKPTSPAVAKSTSPASSKTRSKQTDPFASSEPVFVTTSPGFSEPARPDPDARRLRKEVHVPRRVAKPEAPPEDGRAVDAWAADGRDHRRVDEVVEREVQRAHAEWVQRLEAEADAFDARARRWERDADHDDQRRRALYRAWDRQIDSYGEAQPAPRTSEVVGPYYFPGKDEDSADESPSHTHEEKEVASAE